MKNNLIKKFIIIISIVFITIIMHNNISNAYEETVIESDFISITHTNLSTNETENINISTKDTGNTLEPYIPKDNRNIHINNFNEETISPLGIIGDVDDRSLITDTTQYPYSAIAYIQSTFSDGSVYAGTAFLIGPNKALTNAHVIYNKQLGQLAEKVQVIPGKNGPYFWNNPFQSSFVKECYIPEQYKTVYGEPTDYVRYDWAVLKLDENIGNTCKWLNLQSGGFTIGVDGPDYHLSGYPVHDVDNSNYSEFQTDELDKHYKEYQYHATGKIFRSTLHYMEHGIDMISGQSGSPIYTFGNDGTVKVVGINTAEEYRYFVLNYAKAITAEIINTATSF